MCLFLRNFLSALSLLVFPALAITGVNPSGDSSTWSQNSTGANVTAGYIYQATLSVSEQTYRWAALWGNISGSMVLRDSSSNQFLEWTVDDVQNGSVLYATTYSGIPDPTNFSSTNLTFLELADSAYGFSTEVTDSITHTFTGQSNFQSPSMETPVPANSTLVSGVWNNYMLRRTAEWPGGQYPGNQDHFIWAVEIQNDRPSFAGGTADYQLVIPENQENGQGKGEVTTYYFWVELK